MRLQIIAFLVGTAYNLLLLKQKPFRGIAKNLIAMLQLKYLTEVTKAFDKTDNIINCSNLYKKKPLTELIGMKC